MPGYGMNQPRPQPPPGGGMSARQPQQGPPMGQGPPPPPPGSMQITPPQQAQQMGPDTGYMPQQGPPMGPGPQGPIAQPQTMPGMPMGGGMQQDPLAQLRALLSQQMTAAPSRNPFLDYVLKNRLMGG